ncbi:bifunctional protein-disulfide isomerase/oxidoreductase DsbC [[Haemophilus] felis]|nr:bifunctional protein-disulfide isomerase/oxidoreductase DsbC [[Haemophilus] felis]
MKKSILGSLFLASTSFAFANTTLLTDNLSKLGLSDINISPSPLAGLKMATTNQGIFYISEDGKYLLEGKLYEITNKGVRDLSSAVLLEKLNSYQNEMIIYPAKNEKHVVTVFFDITCHYCHKLHEQIQAYNDLGITVRYLAFPRGGMNKTAQQMETIFTAPDKVYALNEAEKGRLPKQLKQPDIVKKHYQLGLQFGVQGTPTIITDKGEVIGGYLPPAALLNALEKNN